MRNAFNHVIKESYLEEIGGYQISVYSAKDYHYDSYPSFLYPLQCHYESGLAPQKIHCNAGEWTKIPFGTAQTGAYSISYYRTITTQYSVVALHYPFGNFGIFFCPQIIHEGKTDNQWVQGDSYPYLQGVKLSNISCEGFIKKIKDDFNIDLQGFVVEQSRMRFVDTGQ